MRSIFYLNAIAYQTDSLVEKTHVVIGQRDENATKPERWNVRDTLKPEDLTPEEQLAFRRYSREISDGRYRLRVIEWAKSEGEANMMAEQFTAEGFLNVAVHRVSTTVRSIGGE